MIKRLIAPFIIGITGVAVLLALGVWQVQRLGWKTGVLAEIEARMDGGAKPLPVDPTEANDKYRPVIVTGDFTGEELHVLVSLKHHGPGYRIIAVFETGQRRVMVDRGFVAEADKNKTRAPVFARIIGNLHWPDEVDGFTPMPDLEKNIWFARDVVAMAEALETEPTLVILRAVNPDTQGITPLPLDTTTIPNDHLQYAVTWFALAAVWAGMAAYWVWRIRRID